MIISRIFGGLGNQMFQYAAGKRLALKCKTDLKLDLSWFEANDERKFELSIFNTDLKRASKDEIDRTAGRGVFRKLWVKLRLRKPTHFRPQSSFDERALGLEEPAYLNGYFQSERYFFDIKEEIARAFSFKVPLPTRCVPLADRISTTESVSVHVRRGDYASRPVNRAKYVQLTKEYYNECAARMRHAVPKARFYLFSDDPTWVNENLGDWDDAEIVDVNRNGDAFEDLRLMTMCRHNIIADSTFSWWGAWLNANPNKRVFAPARWFADRPAEAEAGLVPDSWQKV